MAGDMTIYTTYGIKIKHYNHIFYNLAKNTLYDNINTRQTLIVYKK